MSMLMKCFCICFNFFLKEAELENQIFSAKKNQRTKLVNVIMHLCIAIHNSLTCLYFEKQAKRRGGFLSFKCVIIALYLGVKPRSHDGSLFALNKVDNRYNIYFIFSRCFSNHHFRTLLPFENNNDTNFFLRLLLTVVVEQ